MRITLSGTVFNITRKDVEKKLKGIGSEEGRAKYFIDVGEKTIPLNKH